MTATPYRAISWNPDELLSEDKMDQLVNNVQWLYENTPRAVYSLASSTVRTENVRIACGRATITARKADHASTHVNFSNLFSPGCGPVITTGVVAATQVNIFCTINGLGTLLQPDYRGFQIFVNIAATVKKNDRIKSNFYIHWQAMGY